MFDRHLEIHISYHILIMISALNAYMCTFVCVCETSSDTCIIVSSNRRDFGVTDLLAFNLNQRSCNSFCGPIAVCITRLPFHRSAEL